MLKLIFAIASAICFGLQFVRAGGNLDWNGGGLMFAIIAILIV